MRSFAKPHVLAAAMILLPAALLAGDVDTKFHNAPASAQAAKNPYAGQQEAAHVGKQLYTSDCLSCHGMPGQNTSRGPSLLSGRLDSVRPGEVFWFITVWGRPVGVTVAPDGSLLVSDDGSNSVWRVSYTGK
jgi:glucose/arabinose dehydrogenase